MKQLPTPQKPMRPGGVREMLAVALPMVASAACETVMTLTDRLFLSRIGSELMSAAMAGGLTCFMLTTFFVGLTGYTTALVAQHLGSGRRERCAVSVTQALLVAVAAYPVILLLRPFAHLLFDVSGIAPEQLVPQRRYFDILVWGTLIGLLRNCLAGFFSGLGRTRIVMAASLAAMVANVAANYVLIFGKLGCPALGIDGAAYGTVLGSAVGLGVLLVGYLEPRNRREFGVGASLRFDREVMGKLLRFGYPGGIELFLNLLAFNLLILAFHSRGLEAAAAVTVVFNWDMVSFVPLIGVNIGVTSLVGRYMGAGDPDTAHRATMSGLKLAWMYGACTLAAFALFPGPLVQVFRPEHNPEVFDRAAPLAVFMLRLAAIYVLADAMNLVFSGALRGAGDTLWAMIISVGLHWALVGVLLVMLRVWNMPVGDAWVALVILILAFTGVFYLRYRAGHWRNIRVVEPQEHAVTPPTDGLHETPDL